MEPNPNNFPILSHVMGRMAPKLPQIREGFINGGNHDSSSSSSSVHIDIERFGSLDSEEQELVNQMPHLKQPNVISSMTDAISNVSQARSVIKSLGIRPDHETVELARERIKDIDSKLSKELEVIVLAQRPEGINRMEWRTQQAEKEKECRQKAEKENYAFRAVVQLDEMHEAYEKMLRDTEEKLVELYGSVEENSGTLSFDEEVKEELVSVLQEALEKNL